MCSSLCYGAQILMQLARAYKEVAHKSVTPSQPIMQSSTPLTFQCHANEMGRSSLKDCEGRLQAQGQS